MKTIEIENTGKGIIGVGGDLALSLKPGVNAVPVEKWAAAKEVATIKHHLQTKRLVENPAKPAPVVSTTKTTGTDMKVLDAAGLKAMTEEQAIEAVGKVDSVDVLYGLVDGEERKKVGKAIIDRLEKLEKKK